MHFRDRIKDLRRVKASELRPHPKNWRTHPTAQRNALKGILAEIGYADALIARELPDGALELIDGHLRAETTPDQEVPVLVLDVTAEEAEKLLLTLDPLAALAKANTTRLDELLRTVETKNDALADLMQELGQKFGVSAGLDGIMEDVPPLRPDDASRKRGDLITLGRHRLLCGDSSSAQDLDALLGGAAIHVVNTDPPYNVKVEPRSNNAIAAGLSSFPSMTHHQRFDAKRNPDAAKPTHATLRAKDRPLVNDFMSDEDFAAMLLSWFGNASRVLVPGGAFYIWGGYANVANYPPALQAVGFYFSQALIWVKGHPVLTRKDFMGNHEWCFYGWKEGAAHRFFGPANIPDVWEVKKVNPQSMVHLTEKPVELGARAILYSSKEGEAVLDLFGGSGSTLMAAEQTGRRAFLMEIDELYCDVIVSRFEAATWIKATRESIVPAAVS